MPGVQVYFRFVQWNCHLFQVYFVICTEMLHSFEMWSNWFSVFWNKWERISEDKLKVSCLGQPLLLRWLLYFFYWSKKIEINSIYLFVSEINVKAREGFSLWSIVEFSEAFVAPLWESFPLRPDVGALGIALKKSMARTWGWAWSIYLFTFRNAKYYLGNMCCGCKGRAVCLCDPRSGSLSLWTSHDFHLLPWRRECSIFSRSWLSVLYTVAAALCREK